MIQDIQRRLVDEERSEYHVTDSQGNSVKYILHDGHKYYRFALPGNVQKTLNRIADIPCWDDDIFLLNYPKSGNHWLSCVVSMVVNGNTEYVGLPCKLDDIEQFSSLPSPRIITSQVPFMLCPTAMKEGKSRVITMYRNPKDTMVSSYTYGKKLYRETGAYSGSWDGYFKFYLSKDGMEITSDRIINGTWFENMKRWESVVKEYPDKEILFISFEDMKHNLYEQIMKIAEFLGINHSENFLRKVTDKCTFISMKENANKHRKPDRSREMMCKDGILPVYRKGEVGDWKNWFTVAQNEIFDAVYEMEMQDHDLSFLQNY